MQNNWLKHTYFDFLQAIINLEDLVFFFFFMSHEKLS